MEQISFTPRRAVPLADRLAQRITAWRDALRKARSDAELERTLEGYDEHLLRDMGLVRSGDRIARVDPSRSPWR
jgi:hypothetical protein